MIMMVVGLELVNEDGKQKRKGGVLVQFSSVGLA